MLHVISCRNLPVSFTMEIVNDRSNVCDKLNYTPYIEEKLK